MIKKNAPVSFAIALPMVDLPQPGGPCKRTPLGGFIPIVSNIIGNFNGSSINSLIYCNSLLIPPKSEYPTKSLRFASFSERETG